MIRRPLVCAAVLALLFIASPEDAHSAENGMTVTGKVELPPVNQRKQAPKRGKAFISRAKNPLKAPSGHDPRLQMVVVLEGGPVDDSDKKPRTSRYNIIGENFSSNILPVIVGGKVEIRNLGRRTPRLYSTFAEDMVPSDPINKNGVRATKPITELHKPIDIRDRDSIHFLAHIVSFKHAYFSVLDHDGKFSIKGVPPGTWNVKIWFQDAWVTNTPKTTVTVASKRAPKAVRLTLPARLTTASTSK